MQNIVVKVDKNVMTIVVKLDQDLGPSKSGKTRLIATSAGNVRVEGTDAFIGLNVYRKETA